LSNRPSDAMTTISPAISGIEAVSASIGCSKIPYHCDEYITTLNCKGTLQSTLLLPHIHHHHFLIEMGN
jgi:hypothetical protein